MTETPAEHAQAVDAWLRSSAGPGAELRDLQRVLDALWRRAGATLGEITLIAISERVLCDVVERFPDFVALSVEAGGMRCEPLVAKGTTMRHDELRQAIRFLLVTWLTVLGNLTAEILTPALHEELAQPARDEPEPTP